MNWGGAIHGEIQSILSLSLANYVEKKKISQVPRGFFFFSFLKIEVLFLSNKTHTF